MLEKIFGKGSVSRTIGTRTNVVRFPKGKQPIDPTVGNFDVEGTAIKSPDLVQTIENSIEDRMGDITKMNDQELLTYTANVRRLLNFKEPPIQNADVVKFGSGEEIKGKGLEQLIEKQGTKNPPTTVAGQLETTGKRLEQLGKDFSKEFDVENIAKQEANRQAMIARQYEGKGYAGGTFGPSGMYRAVARDFLLDQHAKGKIKLDADTLKNLEERNYISGGQPLMYADPIRVMRYHYGDDVFEKIPLDKIPTGARSEIIDVMSKVEAPPVKTEAPKTPGGYLTPGEYRANIEEMQKIEDMIKRRESRFADMTEEEIQNELAQYGGKRSSFEMGLEYDYPEEYAKYKTPKKPEPEEKADGGRIGYAKGKRVKSSIDKLLENLNKKTQGKKSMESVDPKTGEVTIPKKPIRKAEEPTGMTTMDPEPEIIDERSITKTKQPIIRTTEDIEKEIDELATTPIITLEGQRKYNDLHLEFINSLDPRKKNKNLDYRRKTLDTENRLILKAEEQGLDYDIFEKLRKGLYGPRKQQTLDFIKTGKVNVEPVKSATTFEEVQKRYGIAAKAADEIFPNYNTPKTAASELANVMAEQKYGKVFDDLSGDIQQELYEEAFDYITSVNRLPKISPPNRLVPPGTEFNISDPKTAEAFTNFAKENDPEGFKKIQKIVDDINNKNMLEDFDIKGREPNANGGIAGLL